MSSLCPTLVVVARPWTNLAFASALLALAACGNEGTGTGHGAAISAASGLPARPQSSAITGATGPGSERGALTPPGSPDSPPSTVPALPEGDAARGRELALTFECNRCHDGTGHPAMATERHCTHCHEDIARGRFGMGSPRLGRWRTTTAPYRHAPSLEAAGRRLRPEWIARFLLSPYDLRPHLAATMPRLDLSAKDAADLAAFLTREGGAGADPSESGNVTQGRALVETKGCGGCHEMSGAAPLPSRPDATAGDDRQRKGVMLAPDLRHTRDRFRTDTLEAWLLSPASLKPDTVMPSHGLTPSEARDVAAYLLSTPLGPATPPSVAPRLPLLTRAVSYEEVESRVLSITCRHCHTDPDSAGGDGGPGNTGGFGFRPRGLDLSTYGGAAAGYVDPEGRRHSIFAKGDDGTPHLVRALLARRTEEGGGVVPGVRGMPLGLPSISATDLQLVETWIAQGRPR